MKKSIFSFVFCAIGAFAFSQTTYTTTNFGAWDDPARWAGGMVPPTTIGATDIVNLNHNTFIKSKDIVNNGTININAGAGYQDGSTITNNGKIIIAKNASLTGNRNAGNFTNNYAIDINGSLTHVKDLLNYGYIFNQGDIYNFQKLFYDGVTMNCSDWGRLVNNNVLCNNNGGFVNNDCGSVTTGTPAINSCDALKSTIMNAPLLAVSDAKSKDLKVYPNPTTGVFTIDLDSDNSEVKIFDMTGKTIVTKSSQRAKNNQTFDISNLPKGTYILKIKTADNNEVVKKIIKK
ncbi:T9SS type A sorting domain-containing protein [Epilithonimonas sp. JDS]|uniref:T9SS type A sorting domain-containing protein n=1 Tax=Epilithonimonas sp. JDS TaxID=2902797 RepID=UPI001E63E40A|nr:T9SS type A sorting domain-containing protein [Epilithonimonas sp. JDS]MCD9856315.1 T9SS type A sorting domain-containing protein [Epilithonimonas sp. JDS]